MDTFKIRTKKGRIITLTVIQRTNTHILGNDKFNEAVIIPIKDIDSMLPFHEKQRYNE